MANGHFMKVIEYGSTPVRLSNIIFVLMSEGKKKYFIIHYPIPLSLQGGLTKIKCSKFQGRKEISYGVVKVRDRVKHY